jgi:hypothetical protein
VSYFCRLLVGSEAELRPNTVYAAVDWNGTDITFRKNKISEK